MLPDPVLESLLESILEATERGDRAAVEAIFAAHPEREGELARSLERLRAAGLLEGLMPEAPLPEQLGEFQLLERLGVGGMGVVYRARQTAMGRDVALKLLRPELLYFPGNRRRFQREVEAVSRLAHAGIAAIYSVGEEGGLPFFAMELLDGATLAELLVRLAGRPRKGLRGSDLWAALSAPAGGRAAGPEPEPPPALYRGSYVEAIGRIVLAVAGALEHAHSRGILHRDVKPSNVMLTRDGRVLLLDFGLGQVTGADRLTRTGLQVGSLPYMSPEQARGERTGLDERSDIYALGVSFYECLTGSSPYLDPGSAERTRQRLLEGRPRPPSQALPGLSRDIELVCLKAFDLDPSGRYASAAEFIQDLSAALENRPIRARSRGPAARLLRWCRREPALAAVSALALALAVGLPMGWAVQEAKRSKQLRNLNGELSLALEDSTRQRGLAETNFDAALDAIDRMLARVGSEMLRDIPQVERVRANLLRDAIELEQQLAASRPTDPRLGHSLDRARVDLARVQVQLGDYALACETSRAAEQSMLLNNRPSPGLALELGDLRMSWAEAERQLGNPTNTLERANAAVASLREGLELPGGQGTSELEETLQNALQAAAAYERWAGDRQRAEDLQAEGIALGRRLVEQRPGDKGPRFHLGKSIGSASLWLYEDGQLSDAILKQQEAVLIFEALLQDFPAEPTVRLQLFSALGNLGDMLAEEGELSEALPLLDRAAELGESLVEEFPLAPRYRQNLSVSLLQRANWHLAQGELEPSEPDLRRALVLQDKLINQYPDSAEYAAAIATTSYNLGQVLLALDRRVDGLEVLQHAQGAVQRALVTSPADRQLMGWDRMFTEYLGRVSKESEAR